MMYSCNHNTKLHLLCSVDPVLRDV